MGSIMQGPLSLPGRRMLLTAQGSLHRVYRRTQPTVEVKTSWHQTHMRQLGVRGYANSSIDIKETKSKGFREGDKGTFAFLESMFSSAGSTTALKKLSISCLDTYTPKQQSMYPLEVQDLPEIPPVPASPTFHISPEDITTYIEPLVSHQWIINKGRGEYAILSLKRHYEFKGFNGVMDFVQGVADISRKENHHARIVIEYNTVDIFSHTHSAFTFDHMENENSESKEVPGLTRRDIRFAIKVEKLYETFKERERTTQFVPAALAQLQRRSMNSALRRYGRTVTKAEDAHSTSINNAMKFQRRKNDPDLAALLKQLSRN